MPTLRQGALGSLTSTTSTAGTNIADLEDVRVHVAGTFVGTWFVDVSFDGGTTWIAFDTDTAPKLTAQLPPAGMVRGRCSAYTSGTILFNFGGRDTDRLG
jgi:hypothetical protein